MQSDLTNLVDRLLPRLDALTAKLGQGGSWAWHLALRQVYIAAGQEIAWALLIISGSIYGLTRMWKWANTHDERDNPGVIVGTVAICAANVGAFALLADALAYLLNPQYWALMDLLSHLHGGN